MFIFAFRIGCIRSQLGIEGISVNEVFRSLRVLQKQKDIPAGVLRGLWGLVEDNEMRVAKLLSQSCLVLLVMGYERRVQRLSMHDLVNDLSSLQAQKVEGQGYWHGKLINAQWRGVGWGSREAAVEGWLEAVKNCD